MREPLLLTVSQLNNYIKAIMDEDEHLTRVHVCGEIFDCKHYRQSGHIYLSIKDAQSTLRAVIFKTNAQRLPFTPEDGMEVVASGRVSVYPQSGQYQLYVDDLSPKGEGALNLAFRQLFQRLEKQGLFEESHKKELPLHPMRAGLITSPHGAAYHDVVKIITRRFPLCEIVFAPAQVQGDGAAGQMIQALRLLEKASVDVIILTRGGGSAEDLWAFNDETLARAVFNCSIPVVSAVGHETDFTICDYVSDLRAPTPSAAAELVTPDREELIQQVHGLSLRITGRTAQIIQHQKMRLALLSGQMESIKSKLVISQKNHVDTLTEAMKNNLRRLFEYKRHHLASCAEKLDALSPLKLLSKGYGVALLNKKTVYSVKQIKAGDELSLRLADGHILCDVKEIECE